MKQDIRCPNMCGSPASNPRLLSEVLRVRIMIMIMLVTAYTTAASCSCSIKHPKKSFPLNVFGAEKPHFVDLYRKHFVPFKDKITMHDSFSLQTL